ncbi:MAG: transporter [Candidatus Riflebacteria bacterium]|nr:transporter [Candidatus Riflebacteria bacterium]
MLKRSLLLLFFAGLLISQNAFGKEGGDQYPLGAENFLAGMLPPPGTYFINYFGFYTGKLLDGNGKEVPGVKAQATIDAMRFAHVTTQKIFGGDWGMHMIVPFIHQNIDTPAGRNTANGMGDITIDPFVLAWHKPQLHIFTGLDITFPTGSYDSSTPLKNLGSNFRSYMPVLAFTYLEKGGFEGSVKFMYNVKDKNNDTNYQSGNEFQLDYLLAKHVKEWAYGLGGFFLQQTQDDKLNGVDIGNRGKVFAVGPHIDYNYHGRNFILTWAHETNVENRFSGEKIFFKYVMRF